MSAPGRDAEARRCASADGPKQASGYLSLSLSPSLSLSLFLSISLSHYLFLFICLSLFLFLSLFLSLSLSLSTSLSLSLSRFLGARSRPPPSAPRRSSCEPQVKSWSAILYYTILDYTRLYYPAASRRRSPAWGSRLRGVRADTRCENPQESVFSTRVVNCSYFAYTKNHSNRRFG